jgi:hypothetical protein
LQTYNNMMNQIAANQAEMQMGVYSQMGQAAQQQALQNQQINAQQAMQGRQLGAQTAMQGAALSAQSNAQAQQGLQNWANSMAPQPYNVSNQGTGALGDTGPGGQGGLIGGTAMGNTYGQAANAMAAQQGMQAAPTTSGGTDLSDLTWD